jgi:hypothetical protein
MTNPGKVTIWMLLLAAGLLPVLSVAGQDFQPPAQEQKVAESPELVVPAGTVLPVVLNTYLSTKNTQAGDVFYADTVYPIWIQQRLIIPRGSIVKGTVTEVYKPGTFKGKGKMAVRFDSVLLPNGVERPLIAAFHGIHGPGAEKIDRKTETVEAGGSTNAGAAAGTVVGTAAMGSIIGTQVSHGASPALIGAGAGAAAGTAIVLLGRDRHLSLQDGTQLDIELRQPLRFTYTEIMFTQSEMGRAVQNRPNRNKSQAKPGGTPKFGIPGIPGIWR